MKKFLSRWNHSILPICILLALGFAGCGKNCKKDSKKVAQSVVGAENATKMAKGQDVPIYQENEEFFNFEDKGVKDYAFVPMDDEDLEDGDLSVAENDDFDYEWEDDGEMKLAWEDEPEGQEYSFKVVNFDLNKNSIRSDQKATVKENVKLAKNAAEEGKSLIVSGHTCPLGSASFNLSLSEKRAQSIRNEMVKAGIPDEQVTILGCGAEHPVVLSNSSDRATRIQELSANRRAEISMH